MGDWRGLSRSNLFEGRDLTVTTDFRDLFSEVAASALGPPKTVGLFPGYRLSTPPGVMADGRTIIHNPPAQPKERELLLLPLPALPNRLPGANDDAR